MDRKIFILEFERREVDRAATQRRPLNRAGEGCVGNGTLLP